MGKCYSLVKVALLTGSQRWDVKVSEPHSRYLTYYLQLIYTHMHQLYDVDFTVLILTEVLICSEDYSMTVKSLTLDRRNF